MAKRRTGIVAIFHLSPKISLIVELLQLKDPIAKRDIETTYFFFFFYVVFDLLRVFTLITKLRYLGVKLAASRTCHRHMEITKLNMKEVGHFLKAFVNPL